MNLLPIFYWIKVQGVDSRWMIFCDITVLAQVQAMCSSRTLSSKQLNWQINATFSSLQQFQHHKMPNTSLSDHWWYVTSRRSTTFVKTLLKWHWTSGSRPAYKHKHQITINRQINLRVLFCLIPLKSKSKAKVYYNIKVRLCFLKRYDEWRRSTSETIMQSTDINVISI